MHTSYLNVLDNDNKGIFSVTLPSPVIRKDRALSISFLLEQTFFTIYSLCYEFNKHGPIM